MAIVKPEEMNFSDKNIIMIITGLPGVGKTTLALSAPNPVLIDEDKGIVRVRPEHRKDSSICNTYEELQEDVKAFEGKYETVIVDTGGSLIDLLKDWAVRTESSARKKSGGISQQGFGIVKSEFLRLSAELRQKFNVIFLFHVSKSKDNDNIFYDLVCEGSAKTLVWQPADLGANLFIQNGERYIGFSPTSEYSAKAAYGIKGLVRVPELKEGEPNVFLTKLFAQVKSFLADEAQALKPQKEAYNEIMATGKKLIFDIDSPEKALPALNKIRAMKHSLTSKTELESAFKTKVAELGYTYDGKQKQYVLKEG